MPSTNYNLPPISDVPPTSDKGNSSPSIQSMEEDGILFLSGDINFESCNQISKHIIQSNYEAKTDYIHLLISSPGGMCDAGFSLIDVMEWSKVPVYTTALGQACSMGLLILMSGEPGHRMCSRNTTLMSHRFSGLNYGNYSELVAYRTREDKLHENMIDHYLRHTKLKNRKQVEQILLKDVDNWLTPVQAVTYGLIDSILKPKEGLVKR